MIPIAWLLRQVWDRRLLVIAFAVMGLLYGVWGAHRAGPSYLGQVQVIPAESDADRIGGLAPVSALFGRSTDAPPSKFQQFQLAIYSAPVAELMEKRYGMICRISPACDRATGRWAPRVGLRAELSRTIRGILGMPIKMTNQPTPVEMAQLIAGRVTIRGANVQTMAMSDGDPALIVTFMTRLIETTNEYLKENDRQSLRQYVDYLSRRLENLAVVGQRDSLQNLLTEQSRRLMLTEVDVPYAAAILGSVTSSPQSPIPRIFVLTFLAFLGGIGFSILAGFFPGIFARLRLRSGAN